MIFHEKKFFNIDPMKTGATTVQAWLETVFDMPRDNFYRKHWSYREQIEVLQKQGITEKYYSFGFVRNTWARFVSNYTFNKDNLFPNTSFIEYIEADLESPIKWDQYSWFIGVDNQIKVDYIGRTETMDKDIKHLSDILGIPNMELPRLNKTRHEHYTKYYTPELKRGIEYKYRHEIEEFGFVFGE